MWKKINSLVFPVAKRNFDRAIQTAFLGDRNSLLISTQGKFLGVKSAAHTDLESNRGDGVLQMSKLKPKGRKFDSYFL